MDKLLDASPQSRQRVAGKAYFISDNSPIENFEFLKPLCITRGHHYPTTVVPVNVMFGVSKCFEWVYFFGRSFGLDLPLPLTRAEVAKVGVSHHFSIQPATEDFGYEPKFDSFEGSWRLAMFYKDFPRDSMFEFADPLWVVLVVMGMALLAAVAFFDDSAIEEHCILSMVYELGKFIFRSKANLQTLFCCASLLHFMEALFAMSIALSFCPRTTFLWFFQTLLLGYPSLKLLLRQSQENK